MPCARARGRANLYCDDDAFARAAACLCIAETDRVVRTRTEDFPQVQRRSGDPRRAKVELQFSGSEPIVDGMELVPLSGHTPGHTGYEFSSKGQKILFWGDTIHAQRVQLQHPEVTVVFDIDPTAAAATRNQLLPKLADEGVVI